VGSETFVISYPSRFYHTPLLKSVFPCISSQMHRVVFYSWQSDLPNATNRSFIEQALKNVANRITADDAVDVEPVIDRDTQGVAGAPDIAKTIFQKIASADVVVADVSIIGECRTGRPTPNPNVLIELGYALRAVGDERVILVFNTAYGEFEQLPFDLKMRRALPYYMPQSTTDRATERKGLEAKLEPAIRAELASIRIEPPRSLLIEAIESVERGAPNRVIIVRRFLSELLTRIEKKRPASVAVGATAKDLEDAVRRTDDIALDFARLADVAAIVGDEDTLRTLYVGFGALVEQYDLAEGFSGRFYTQDFDFIKFLGHELFTSLVACLIRENRWELIAKLLTEGIPVKYMRRESGPGNCYFWDISEHLEFGRVLDQERSRLSVHADILKALHDPELPLGKIIPFSDFVAADYFLFLRGRLAPETPSPFFTWRPWSTVFLISVPGFLRGAEDSAFAQRVSAALGVPDLATLRQRLAERAPQLEKMWKRGRGTNHSVRLILIE
jgi:hypothetical protein